MIIGSRGSALALWQSRWIQARLAALGEECEIHIYKTTGDRITDVPLAKVGTKGLFTKELEEALLAGEIDLAVHSMKDMPTDLPPGLTIAAIPERADARDAMVGRALADLPHGAKVGTSSLRRSAQLHAARPDLLIESVRGNVDTRLRKLDEGQYDALMLASAGLDRLGLHGRIAERVAVDDSCPAVGQGALAVETRTDGAAYELVARLNHAVTAAAIRAERAALAEMGGGCQVPLGAHATLQDSDTLQIVGVVVRPDGRRLIRRERTGSAADPAALGRALAADLLNAGGREILAAVYGAVDHP